METRDAIIGLIDGYLEETGMSEHAFGQQAMNDHKFVRRLRSGIGVTLTSIERAERYIRENPASDEAAA